MDIAERIEATRTQAINMNTPTDWMTHAENCIEQLRDGDLSQEVRVHLANEATSALMVVRELEQIWPEGTQDMIEAAWRGEELEMRNEVRLIDKLRRELNS